MRFFITKKNLVWVIFLLCAVLFAVALSSCGTSVAGLRPPGAPHDGGALPGIAGTIARIAVLVSSVATIALVLCGVAAFFAPNKFAVAKIACAAFAALVSAGLLYWLAQHWALAIGCAGVVLVLGLVGYGYLHRKELEKRLGVDLDGDGKKG